MKTKPRNRTRILVMDYSSDMEVAKYKGGRVWFDTEPHRGRVLDDFEGWIYIKELKKLMNK